MAREALAEPAVPVVLEVRVALVVPEDPAVPAVLENPVVPAELEHGPVAAEREPDQVAVPLRIKSVIAVHHRGRVPLLAAVEDLAAVAETTREPAAAEAVRAWAAAE